MPTKRLYWEDDHQLVAEGVVLAVKDDRLAVDQTCFYGGGGGQPPDHGRLVFDDSTLSVIDIKADDDGILWHCCSPLATSAQVGKKVIMEVDGARLDALSRYHTVLHLVNTIALREHGAWITGAQIEVGYARIDFKWEGFSPSLCGEIERKVNEQVSADHAIRAYTLTEQEFAARPELLRTLEARPPVVEGRVRVVEIETFDAQACGGTHVRSSGSIGAFSITRTENKGRINKRLYVQLA